MKSPANLFFGSEDAPEGFAISSAPAADSVFEDLAAAWHQDDQGEIRSSLGLDAPSPRSRAARVACPSVGEELAGFRLLAVLGGGAEGKVFLAAQTNLADRPVVLKITELRGGEHRSLARLQHTHIVPILSYQDLPDLGLRLLCLPYLGGTTLERMLDEMAGSPPSERSGLDVLKALDQATGAAPLATPGAGPARAYLAAESYERAIGWIALCLAEALHHAHLRDLVHCDVKPANILIAADGMPLLLDFHLAQSPMGAEGMRPEKIGGTPPFMAPEQLQSMLAAKDGRPAPPVGSTADIYALGVVLHVALTEKPPRHGGRIAAPMRRANPRVSAGLAEIVAHCVETDPRRRYPDAALLADDLRRHLDDLPMTGVANRSLPERYAKWRRHHPVALASAGAVVTALLSLAVAGLIACFAADRRLADASVELDRGRRQREAGDHRESTRSLEHGLSVLRSGTLPDCLSPRARETRQALVAEVDRTRRAHLIVELHEVADRVRFLYATGPRDSPTTRKLERRLSEVYQVRDVIDRQLAREADDVSRARIRGDLLDLAILRADLRVELADPAGRDQARRDALQSLSQAEADWGPSPVLVQEQRFHARALGSPDRAGATRDEATSLSPRTPWECYALGRALLRNGDLEAAATALDRAAELQPQSLWAQFYRGQCALRRGRHAEAIDAFGACVALAPEAVCYYNRSLAYAGLGFPDRARLDLGRAFALDPGLRVNSRDAAPRPPTTLLPGRR